MKRSVWLLGGGAWVLLALTLGWAYGGDTKRPAHGPSAMGLSPVLRDAIDGWQAMAPVTKIAEPAAAPYQSVLKEARQTRRHEDWLVFSRDAYDPREGRKSPDPVSELLAGTVLPDRAQALSQKLAARRVYRVLQFREALGETVLERLHAQGLSAVAFIPNRAYVVAAPADKSDRFDAIKGLRWQGEVPLSAKLNDAMTALLTDTAPDTVTIQVGAYPGESLADWDTYAYALGATFLYQKSEDGRPRLLARVAGSFAATFAAGFARLPAVESVHVFALPKTMNHGSIYLMQSGDTTLKTTPIFDAGITGTGQVYAAADSGLDVDACQFRYGADASAVTLQNDTQPPDINITNPDNKVLTYYVITGCDAYDDSSGGFHGTGTTGCAVGDNYQYLATQNDPGIDLNDGMAPGAKIVFQDVGTDGGLLAGLFFASPYRLNKQAYLSGARVHNDSYGLESNASGYDQDSQHLDTFAYEFQDYLNVFAAGNSGPNDKTLGGEGSTAKNTLAVGACLPGWSSRGGIDLASFSSRGPTDDGRIKPDLVAPGVIETATEIGGTAVEGKTDEYGNQIYASDPANGNCATARTAGTSFASPTAAGMALLAREYYTDGFYPTGRRNATDGFTPTSALIRATLLNSSRPLTGGVTYFLSSGSQVRGTVPAIPSSAQGYGRITLDDALYLAGDKRDLVVLADIANNAAQGTLATADVKEYQVVVKADMDFKVTLSWIDPPASTLTGRNLVNDLDLEVIAPNGTRYLGNVNYINNYSQPIPATDPADSSDDSDGSDVVFAPDTVNNNEQVWVEHPAAGTWTVRVTARDVPGTSETSPYPSTHQGYALLATGNLGDKQDAAQARLSAQFQGLSGGCDNDVSLDKNEKAKITLLLTNYGDLASTSLHATLAVDSASSSVDPSLLLVDDDSSDTDIGVLEPGKQTTLALTVGMADSDSDVCGKRAAFLFTLTDASGATVLTRDINVPTGYDYNADGTRICQTKLCNPAPVITGFSRQTLDIGDHDFSLDFSGQYFYDGMTFRFADPAVTYTQLEIYSPLEAHLSGVTVGTAAVVGPLSVYVANTGDVEKKIDGLLTIESLTADGDNEAADADSESSSEETHHHKGGGCSSVSLHGAWMLAALAALFVRRRIRA